MNNLATSNAGLSAVISNLQKKKEELSTIYRSAITNGEEIDNIKNIYLSLKDVEKRLEDLLRCNFIITS